ncbi:MAG: polysaccharide biosynthesis tyrosine autokinase, partial [Puniceicoccales bacterium]
VNIRQAEDASAFDLQAIGDEPQYVQYSLDAVMHEFLAFKAERRKQTTEKTFLTIMEKVLEKQEEIEAFEEQKLAFQRANNIVFITEQGNNAGSYLAELNNKRAQLRTEIRLLSTLGKSDNAQGKLDALTESRLSALDVNYENAKQEVERLRAERDEFSIYMKAAHPKIRRLDQEIERQANLLNIYRRQTLGQLDQRRQQLEAELANLDEAISEWETQALKFSTLLAEFGRLNSRLDSAKSVHDRLLASIDSLDITKNTHQETISILQQATRARQLPMEKTKQITMGGVAGLAIGIAILAVVSALDTRVVSAEDLSARFGPPVLGVIPLQSGNKGKRLKLLQPGDERVIFAESCRNIRSSLLFMDLDGQRPQVIMMTSAVPSEGKSTLSSNLGITLAFAQSRTLLVDADLRRGRVHAEFDMDHTPGLAELIEDSSLRLEDVLRPSGVANLDVITCGEYPERPGELLLSRRFEELLKQMRQEYDYIIFDCPPVLATDDTPSFANKADAILFMVRSSYTRFGQIKSSLDILELRGMAVDGFVLNFVDTRQRSHYYYYNQYNDYYTYRPKGKGSPGSDKSTLTAS